MPAFRDGYDLPLTSSSQEAVERYVEGVGIILKRNSGPEAVLQQAIDLDPEFALAYAALGIPLQMSGEIDDARRAVATARQLVAGATAREKGHVEALAAAVEGESLRAVALIREHVAEHPRDALLLSRANFLLNASGRATRKEESFALYEAAAPHFGDDAWFLGSFSFQHNEMYHFEAARALAERSYARDSRSCDCAHSVAHNLFERGEAGPGAGFLEGWLDGSEWQQQMAGHLNWHQTLFELELGQFDRAVGRFSRVLLPSVYPGGSRQATLTDAASFLWRCELLGIEPPAGAAAAVAAYAKRDFPKAGQSFPDAHKAMAYALARDEDACTRLAAETEALLQADKHAAGPVSLAVIRAAKALTDGDPASAAVALEPYAGELVRVGGSRAQYEVLQDTLIVAYLRSGQPEKAEPLLRQRLQRRFSRRDQLWLDSLAPKATA
jgi:hypothetical protein